MKPTQVSYQLYYRLRKKLGRSEFSKKLEGKPDPLNFIKGISSSVSYSIEKNSFTFLNKEKTFSETIDWNFADHGKLWTYNLNYFDFLVQEGITKEGGLSLIKHYIDSSKKLKDGLEPYPISLRGINWIKFLSENTLQDQEINQCLYDHYYTLYNNREFHLLGNHLLENGFSLFFGAYYFKDKTLLKAAWAILKSELKEQILEDGAHFELSPMYHQIILNRLLDCINIAKSNLWTEFKDLELLSTCAASMLAWLQTITYKNGDIPMVNDSAWGIAPGTNELFEYARRLELNWSVSNLSDSGYRKWGGDNYELLMDVGAIGPDYIPGHAHADTFNFELYLQGKPVIVDTGTSTYEKNQQRQEERSTAAHNTVVIVNENSSHVWGGFRVAERARITRLVENENSIKGEHDGYKNRGLLHQRTFYRAENHLTIEDMITGNKQKSACAYLHFHPSIQAIKVEEHKLILSDPNVQIAFTEGIISIEKIAYNYCTGFNQTEKAIAFKIEFQQHLKTTILL